MFKMMFIKCPSCGSHDVEELSEAPHGKIRCHCFTCDKVFLW